MNPVRNRRERERILVRDASKSERLIFNLFSYEQIWNLKKKSFKNSIRGFNRDLVRFDVSLFTSIQFNNKSLMSVGFGFGFFFR